MRIENRGVEYEILSWERIEEERGVLVLWSEEELKVDSKLCKTSRYRGGTRLEIECRVLKDIEKEEILESSLESIIETVLGQIEVEKAYKTEEDKLEKYKRLDNYEEYTKNDEVKKVKSIDSELESSNYHNLLEEEDYVLDEEDDEDEEGYGYEEEDEYDEDEEVEYLDDFDFEI